MLNLGLFDNEACESAPPCHWTQMEHQLDEQGCARLPGLLDAQQCRDLAALYAREDGFRSRIVMARHGFGRGEYQYFDYPLPPLLQRLREQLYLRLAPVANLWNQRMGLEVRYPDRLQDFLARCHAQGQLRPTPLILQYGAGDYNCLHQDVYGEHVFPLQVVLLLSRPGQDFTGGEFVITQADGDRQRADVMALDQGDALVLAVRHRPVPGRRTGYRRVAMRHGVSRIHSGHRHTVGLIFHDAL
ncbi:2OG-Fe(II) oxygenase [Delftia acidovorans]|uniref:2OG-Fe(II) oxygenase n=1 Tax=Delftia acidovorans TaxID=80866 RepID=UPI00192B5A46|nr:2OG-Fe(II) oxygenase [Delftia acidovorans]